MAVPKRRNVVKNRALRAYFQDLHKKSISKEEKIEEEDHKNRLDLLKSLGLLREGKNE